MNKIIDFVIKKPKKVVIIALLLLIPTLLSYVFTSVNYDILTYLPGNLDSVKGEEILTENYNMGSVTMVLVEDMPSKDVVKLKNKISEVENVSSVLWADDVIDTSVPADILPDAIKNIFYSRDNNYTMMFVFLAKDCTSKQELSTVKNIKTITKNQCLVSGMTAISTDTREISNIELPIYITFGVVLAIIIMMITMDTYVIPFIIVGVLGIAVIYNMGTNFILGSVSYITQCIAAVLQLGVTMDYSIFLVNRYKEERLRSGNKEIAIKNALKASMTSLKGSSLTTLFGFLALCFMQLKLGFNIGIVMAKGVLIGLFSVIAILPAFLLVFDKKIYIKKHKTHIPKFIKSVNFSLKHKKLLTTVSAFIFVPVFILSISVDKYYNLTETLPKDLNSVKALDVLKEDFKMTTSHFIVVHDDIPSKKLLDMETKLKEVDGIDSLVAYNLYLGTSIPDDIVPDEITQLIKQGGYQVMLANSVYEAATDEANEQVRIMSQIVKDCDAEGYITGEGAMYNDLIDVTTVDFTVTSIISIIAIFILIAILFKSFSIPVILIGVIEFAIFINEGISTIFGTPIPFVAPTIISCVQLGATVDYAILLTSRFKEELSVGYDKLTAIKRASIESMKSIFQSSAIFFFVTFGVYIISSMEVVKSICAMLARGSVISAFIILFVLTPLLYLSEGFIRKTTKNWIVPNLNRTIDNSSNYKPIEDIESTVFSFTEFTFTDDEGKE